MQGDGLPDAGKKDTKVSALLTDLLAKYEVMVKTVQ
jgi:hypothetical protein